MFKSRDPGREGFLGFCILWCQLYHYGFHTHTACQSLNHLRRGEQGFSLCTWHPGSFLMLGSYLQLLLCPSLSCLNAVQLPSSQNFPWIYILHDICLLPLASSNSSTHGASWYIFLPDMIESFCVNCSRCHCNEIPERNSRQERDLFWLMVSAILACGWLAPVLWGW